jgi:hypothetical protein
MYHNERLDEPHPRHRPRFTQTENTLHSLQTQSGNKTIVLSLQSNWRGHFIRVIVEENDWYNSIIIPASVTDEFRQCVETVTQGGLAPKGMVESDGKAIFVRIENDDLLLGERTGRHNGSIIIPQAAIGEFKKMLHKLAEVAPANSKQSGQHGKTRMDEKVFYSEKLPAGTKTLHLMLKENPMGRFVRLVEGDGLRFTSAMIPAQQLERFRAMLDEAISVSKQTP